MPLTRAEITSEDLLLGIVNDVEVEESVFGKAATAAALLIFPYAELL